MNYTAIIIDDEESARHTLKLLLKKHFPNITVLGDYESVPDGVLGINKHQPHIVFLDIEMPRYNGFELLGFFQEINFEIIFVTAYNQYALKAFEVAAIDYLLKPIDIKLFKKAVEKATERIGTTQMKEHLDALQRNTTSNAFNRIALPVTEGLLFIEADDIVLIEAGGAYCTIHTTTNEPILVSKPLSYFEDIVSNRNNFYRCHRSYLVNIHFIKKFNRGENSVEVDTGQSVPISRDKKNSFEQLLRNVQR